MKSGFAKTCLVLFSALSLAALSACEQFSGNRQSQSGEQVTASQLVAPPEEGPQIFGPWGEQDQTSSRSSGNNSGNSARVARTDGRSAVTRPAPTRAVSRRTVPAPAPAPAPVQSPAQISAIPPPQLLTGRSGVPAFELGFTETSSGLKYKLTQTGQGPIPRRGDTLVARYQGWIYENGEKGDLFDRSGDRPFTFELGAGRVIEGWDEAFAEMRVGEKRTLIVPSALAYGRTGSPGLIRPNEDLVFDVELVKIQ